MTNPNDIMGTNAGFGGRTSPNAFNDNLSLYSKGVVSGWACTPKSGMTVQLGGSATVRDVAIAEDNAGNKTTINNRLGTPVDITLAGAPVTNSRIDAIVAYVDSPAQGQATDVDYAEATGIIAVEGTASASPTVPSDADIRSAITSDGASGTTAYYVILATITVGTGVTTIGSGVIIAGTNSQLSVTSGDDIVAKAVEALSYKSGDTINVTTGSAAGITITGFLTGGQQSLRAFIPLAKRLNDISTASVTSFKCQARCNGAYLTGLSASDNWGDAVTKSNNVTVAVRPDFGGLDVIFAKTSGTWGGTNNTTVSFEVQTLAISLS